MSGSNVTADRQVVAQQGLLVGDATIDTLTNGGLISDAITADFAIIGTLAKGGGTFLIDHPQDPENRYLSHSFVESPDMMNVYNGNVVLDGRGAARVELPDYFEALNRDFRYQLTCIGGFAPVYVAEKIQDGAFRIAGGKPGLEVSWQVTGIRQDPWANRNRVQVEADKAPADRGRFLFPEAYGEPETRRVRLPRRPPK